MEPIAETNRSRVEMEESKTSIRGSAGPHTQFDTRATASRDSLTPNQLMRPTQEVIAVPGLSLDQIISRAKSNTVIDRLSKLDKNGNRTIDADDILEFVNQEVKQVSLSTPVSSVSYV